MATHTNPPHGGTLIDLQCDTAHALMINRKGMHAKAKAGILKGVTGVDDPYETPESPELYVDTSDITPDESAQEILLYLGQREYI
ncbi:MAG: adenylyl-sulfate kinase [Proteobacteria bacterium]|nr:adenylyl-sulfate kinase [Pseudomonadota bacterium]